MIRRRALLRTHRFQNLPDRLVNGLRPGRARLVSLLLCLVVVTACEATPAMNTPQSSDRDPMQMLTETFSQEQAVAFIGQPFPPGASNLSLMGEAALDTMVIARFDAPRQEIAAYMAELGVTASLQPGYSPFFSADPPFGEAKPWWTPPIAGDLAGDFSGLYQQVGQKHIKVVVVGPESGAATVYLQVYNT